MPVAGLREQRMRRLGHPMALERGEGNVEHRLQVPEVWSVDGDLAVNDQQIILAADARGQTPRLGTGALGAHHPGVWIGEIDRPLRQLRRDERLAIALQNTSERVALRRSPALIASFAAKSTRWFSSSRRAASNNRSS